MAFATERINLRTTAEAKNIIEQAASITGLTVNAFMVQYAYEKARDLIQASHDLKLNNTDRDMVMNALEQPRPTKQALKDLMGLLDEN